ncbi:sensor histidine kinase [Zobellia nedashkovskayae]
MLATKDRLLSIIAHDLRSPFNNITLLSDLLGDSVKRNDVGQSEEYLELINKTTQNTLTLLDNLLNWSKSQTGQLDFKSEKVDVNKVVSQTLELSKAIARTKNIELNYVESDTIQVCSNHKIIKTIIRNLVSNSIKFTKPGGSINVLTTQNKTHLEVTVSDNGVGMSPDICDKLFCVNTNMARVGTASEKGSGFGLVLCKEFVEKLGGEIWAESTLDKGSDFKFTIPLNNNTKPNFNLARN